jgi:hypothetical protein
MSLPRKKFDVAVYREATGRHPSWDDLYKEALKDARVELINAVADSPGTGYVDYHGIRKKVRNHGHKYDNAGHEVVSYRDNGSDTGRGWKGWTTCVLAASFDDAIFDDRE